MLCCIGLDCGYLPVNATLCCGVFVRLERNRASARVRRQRKKSMAELYEKEVARLERLVFWGPVSRFDFRFHFHFHFLDLIAVFCVRACVLVEDADLRRQAHKYSL